MLPIVVGVILFLLIAHVCVVKRKRSANAIPSEETVPLQTHPQPNSLTQVPLPQQLRVLYVSAGALGTASATIIGAVTNPTASAPTTTQSHEAPPSSTEGMFVSLSLPRAESRTVPVAEVDWQPDLSDQPSANPPPKYTPEDPLQGEEEDTPSPQQYAALQSDPIDIGI